MSDQPFEIDFASLKSQAADMLDAAETTPAELPETPAVETSPVETPVVEEPSAVVSAPNPSTLEELDPETHGDRPVRVKVDGEWQTLNLKEVAAGFSRTSHFTRQMQDLAAQRKEVETSRAEFENLRAEQQQLRGFISNKQLLFQFLQQSAPELFQQANQPVQGDPNEIATVQQARELVEAQMRGLQQKMQEGLANVDQRIAAATQKLKDDAETAQFSESINHTVGDIFAKNPILKHVRMAEDILRFEVAKLNPKTIKEADEAFRTVAQGMVEDVTQGFTNLNKTKVVAAAKLTKPRIEPPGGSGPQIQPTTHFKQPDGRLDWKALHAAAKNMVNE